MSIATAATPASGSSASMRRTGWRSTWPEASSTSPTTTPGCSWSVNPRPGRMTPRPILYAGVRRQSAPLPASYLIRATPTGSGPACSARYTRTLPRRALHPLLSRERPALSGTGPPSPLPFTVRNSLVSRRDPPGRRRDHPSRRRPPGTLRPGSRCQSLRFGEERLTTTSVSSRHQTRTDESIIESISVRDRARLLLVDHSSSIIELPELSPDGLDRAPRSSGSATELRPADSRLLSRSHVNRNAATATRIRQTILTVNQARSPSRLPWRSQDVAFRPPNQSSAREFHRSRNVFTSYYEYAISIDRMWFFFNIPERGCILGKNIPPWRITWVSLGDPLIPFPDSGRPAAGIGTHR